MSVSRQGDTLYLRVNLINQAVTTKTPCTISFGLLAAPVKPRTKDWRTLWLDEKFTLLGTCINWLGAPGSCGNVYPPGKDLYFWEMIAPSLMRLRSTPHSRMNGGSKISRIKISSLRLMRLKWFRRSRILTLPYTGIRDHSSMGAI